YFLPAIAYAAIFFRGRVRLALVLLITLDGLGLMWLEWVRPDLTTGFTTPELQAVDIATGFVLSVLLTALMLWIVTRAYDKEQRSRAATVTALHEAREEFARLFQMNPDAVYLVDTTLPAYVDVNHGFERLSGWPKPEAVGRSSADLNLWVDLAERDKFYEELERQGYLQNFLARFRRRDGREVWGSTSASWVEMSGRRMLLLSTRDVTIRIEAQRREAESRALLAALLDSTRDGVWQVEHTRFAFTAFNAAFAERFRREWGVEPQLGKTLEDLVAPEVAGLWRDFYTRALADGPFTTEYALEGGARTTQISLSPVTHEGEVFGVSVFSRDITALKQAAQERAAIEQQLLQSQKMESLGSLAGGVAHDFNNMLAGMMGYAELLLDEETEPKRRRYLQAIMQAASRSSELTRNLLAFGRRGKNIVQSVDLAVIVRDAVTMLKPSMRADVEVATQFVDVWTVDGDPSQMSQVVVNLCINANEAMLQGGQLQIQGRNVTLDTGAARRVGLPAGDYVELRVVDWGVGMTDEVRARIFEPFFTTKVGGQVRGTGLGLSTVYGIVQSHNGNIAVESTPGVGTTFTVFLPKGRLVPELASTPAPIASGTGLILIAEDEAMVRQLLVAAIEGLGYRVIAAEDGEEAVRMFMERRLEITGVVLDLKMPRKGGRDAFLEMRAIDPSVSVLICSGYGDNEEAQSMISLGATGLLGKPFRMSDLAAHLSRLEGRTA
ncbi:MAG: PAS domain S-box protein, partial [Acidobacteria bacterium]|nr:PAS domain S-box protein [Acidobacteriota bacterium]